MTNHSAKNTDRSPQPQEERVPEPGAELIVEIRELAESGDGVAFLNGRKVFVPGTIPGEKARIRISESHQNYLSGTVSGIIESSPWRSRAEITPADSSCLPLRHIAYGRQLEIKKETVESAFRKAGLDLAVPPVTGSGTVSGYRNKTIYYVRQNEDGSPAIGTFGRGSHRITDIETGICASDSGTAWRTGLLVKKWMRENGITGWNEMDETGLVKALVIRVSSSGETMVILVTSKADVPAVKVLAESLEKSGISSFYVNINPLPDNTVMRGDLMLVSGKDHITDRILGLRCRITPFSFFQVNRGQAERLYSCVRDFLGTVPGTVFDLYCGTGTIAMTVSGNAREVYGIEIIDDAVGDARNNAGINGITNCEFISGKSEEIVPELSAKGIKPDAVIVDPPRKGLAGSLVSMLLEMKPERIVYVSCLPKSLARDLKALSAEYRAGKISCFDMFPDTVHVETVVLMSRK
mgnify:FL=1